MSLTLGPILSFRGSTATIWSVSALIVTGIKSSPSLSFTVDGVQSPPETNPKVLLTSGQLRALRYDLNISRPKGPTEAKVEYSVDGANATFHVPGAEMPLQAAYASCNGFSSGETQNKMGSKERHAMWDSLLAQHNDRRSEREPKKSHYHVLLMGGDQLYGDSIFSPAAPLGDWQSKSVKDRLRHKVTKALRQSIAEYYFHILYCSRWSQDGVREAFASIPTIMMWDDHDIFDGWGSYPPEWQKCEVFEKTFDVARDCFRTFQRQLEPAQPHPNAIPGQDTFSAYYQIDDVGILTLDLRSERTEDQIISSATWDAIYAHIERLAKSVSASEVRLQHLLVMTSIPVVYPSFEFAERFFGLVPGQQELEDDMRDHWRSTPHKAERLRFIHNLFNLAKGAKCRITLLSGDVHVPALGVLRNNRADFFGTGNASVIHQLISSGIVHPSAGGLFVFALDKLLAGWDEEVDRDITAAMENLPGTESRLKARRNWLALEFDASPRKRLWASWRLEDEKYPLTKVIHPA